MPVLKPSTFTSYEFTEEELLNASILNHLQKCRIQSEMAIIAEQQLMLTYDPQNPVDFAQQHSFLTGQLSIYRDLIGSSDAAEKTLQRLASLT